MKIKLVLFTLIAGLVSTAGAGELAIGSDLPSPDYTMQAVGGSEVSLKSAMGKEGLVVIFSCNTCPWVMAWEDRYVTLASAYEPKGLGFVAVNSNAAYRTGVDSMDEMAAHAKDKGYNFDYTVDVDSKLAREFGATRTPHVYVFDKLGKLVYRGAIDDNAHKPKAVEETYLADALDALLAGKTIEQNSTKALGCSIKFSD
ncbi:redoxin family protein [Candidatus Neomarinimicrobiota bacterium]